MLLSPLPLALRPLPPPLLFQLDSLLLTLLLVSICFVDTVLDAITKIQLQSLCSYLVFISYVHILCSYLICSYHLIILYLKGETAPDFSLVDQNGKTFTRSKNKKPLVVYFYPADSTPGCTTQAKAFQSEIQDIRKQYKADVGGISGQGAESKQKFASEVS